MFSHLFRILHTSCINRLSYLSSKWQRVSRKYSSTALSGKQFPILRNCSGLSLVICQFWQINLGTIHILRHTFWRLVQPPPPLLSSTVIFFNPPPHPKYHHIVIFLHNPTWLSFIIYFQWHYFTGNNYLIPHYHRHFYKDWSNWC